MVRGTENKASLVAQVTVNTPGPVMFEKGILSLLELPADETDVKGSNLRTNDH